MRAKILQFLRANGPGQAWEVVKAIGEPAEVVWDELRAMRVAGAIHRERKDGRTLWSAPPQDAAAEDEPVEVPAFVLEDERLEDEGRGREENHLAIRHQIGAMVLTFAESEKRIRACFSELVEIHQRLADTFGGYMSIEAGHGHSTSFQNPDETMRSLRRDAYQRLAEKLEIRRAMSIKAAGDLDERLGIRQGQLTVRDFPELTERNVWEFFEPYAVTIPQMFAEAMREVWNWLRPPEPSRWDKGYKTNEASRLVLADKIILEGIVHRGYGRDRWRLSDWSGPRMLALENVFSLLAGKGGIAKTYRGAVSDALAATTDDTFDTPYFYGRVYGNGNMHLRIKRIPYGDPVNGRTLLDEFNARAGGMNLRPGPEEDSIADLLTELRAALEAAALDEEERDALLERVDDARRSIDSMGAARMWARDLVWTRELRPVLPAALLGRLGLGEYVPEPVESDGPDSGVRATPHQEEQEEEEEPEPETLRRPAKQGEG